MILLSERDVERLIDRDLALDAADEAYRLHASGRLSAPGRIDLRRPERKLGALTLAVLGGGGALAVKTNVHSHYGAEGARRTASLLTLWDVEACRPLALLGSAGFNRHRTAAGFGAACRRLAPPEAETLAIFGAGILAPETIRYIAAVRPIRRVLIVGRDPDRAVALAHRVAAWPDFVKIEVDATQDAGAAAAAADIIAAVTSSDVPVFPGAAARPGTFVVLGGANRPTAREADDDLAARATFVVDHLEGCQERAGDLRIPLASGVLPRDRIVGEIGAITGPVAGGDITVFKSIGIATQDLVLAQRLLACAEADRVGSRFDPLTGAVETAAGRSAEAERP